MFHHLRLSKAVAVAAVAMTLAACETTSGPGVDPGAKALPPGASCQSIRAELNKMDSQGAQSKVDRASRGKVDPATQAVADRYNQLLNQYLGARCHS
jgi:predicted small secreted protein